MLKGAKKAQLRFMVISNIKVAIVTINKTGIMDFSQNIK